MTAHDTIAEERTAQEKFTNADEDFGDQATLAQFRSLRQPSDKRPSSYFSFLFLS
ncbi:MAG: hypothetical protein GY842_29205 [bacterium]|nr:hypothetical protein [bacterium]